MKDKRLTDLEDKIKNDVLAGTFNLGDHNDPESVIGIAMSFLRDNESLGDLPGPDKQEAPEVPQEPIKGTYIPFGRLGGVGVMKCKCGCWEGKVCERNKGIN